MSFQKFREIDSAVALREIYSLFRNGMVNMVKAYDEYGRHTGWKSCVSARAVSVPEIAECYKGVDFIVDSLQNLIHGELETEVVIHDVRTEGEDRRYCEGSFTTKVLGHSDKVFHVVIVSEHITLDGGEPGWNQWRMQKVTFSYKGRTVEAHPGSRWSDRERYELPPLARTFIRSDVSGEEILATD